MGGGLVEGHVEAAIQLAHAGGVLLHVHLLKQVGGAGELNFRQVGDRQGKSGGLEGHGLILEHPEAKIAKFAEEHGFLDLTRSNTRPNVGDVVRIVPNHVCVVVNMMDEVVMVRGDEIVGVLPVAARGKLR